MTCEEGQEPKQATVVSFIPERSNLNLYAGDPATLRVAITDPGGSPQALDGTIAAHIKEHRTDEDPLANFDVDDSDAANGVVLLGLSAEQTSELLNGSGSFNGEWDCQWFPTSGEPLTLIQGRVSCVRDVTRIP
jgi:hypothetical protein